MPKFKRGKNLILSFLCVMFVALISFSCVLLIVTHLLNTQEPQSAETSITPMPYIITGEETDTSWYDEYDEFAINTAEGFYSFAIRTHDSSKIERPDYSTKTIYIIENITVNINDWEKQGFLYSFNGVLDGLGHMIYFTGTMKVTRDTGASVGGQAGGQFNNSVFCGINSGTIRNIHFKGISAYIESPGDTAPTCFGALVAANSGVIENCIVEDLKIKSNRYKSHCSVSAIAARIYKPSNIYNPEIKNCIVKGGYVLSGNDGNGLFNQDGMYAYHFNAYGGGGASNCIFVANIETEGDYTEECVSPGDIPEGNYSSYSDAIDNFSEDIISEEVGDIHKNPELSIWYKYKINHGYDGDDTVPIYLRAFITWEEYIFRSNIDSAVSINKKSLIVPSNEELSEWLNPYYNRIEILLYSEWVFMKPRETYVFLDDYLTIEGTICTANVVEKYAYVQFVGATGLSTEPSVSDYFLVDLVKGDIEISDEYNSSTNTIKFTLTKDGENIYVTYTLDSAKIYYYKRGNYSRETKDEIITISPIIDKKSYGVEVG